MSQLHKRWVDVQNGNRYSLTISSLGSNPAYTHDLPKLFAFVPLLQNHCMCCKHGIVVKSTYCISCLFFFFPQLQKCCHYMLPFHCRNIISLDVFPRYNITVIHVDHGKGGASGLMTKGFVGFQGNGVCSDAATQINSLERWFIDQLSDVRSDLFITCLYHRVSLTREENVFIFFLKAVL